MTMVACETPLDDLLSWTDTAAREHRENHLAALDVRNLVAFYDQQFARRSTAGWSWRDTALSVHMLTALLREAAHEHLLDLPPDTTFDLLVADDDTGHMPWRLAPGDVHVSVGLREARVPFDTPATSGRATGTGWDLIEDLWNAVELINIGVRQATPR